VIREMFGYARDHEPCIIFMDEVDAIGGRRFSEGTSADREIQRTLMELLNQMDGFDVLGKVKMIMATNRPDTLDPALLRPGRLDRKIEISLPNEQSRLEILKIHASKLAKVCQSTATGRVPTRRERRVCPGMHWERTSPATLLAPDTLPFAVVCVPRVLQARDIDYEAVVKLSDGFNGADLRNVCTEAGLFAIRAERDVILDEDMMKATRKLVETKKLEGTLEYKKM